MTHVFELWLLPDAVHDGARLRAGHALGLMRAPGGGWRTGALRPAARLAAGARVRRLAGTLAAGFIDLQVNGGGDALLNNEPTAAAMARMAAAHRRLGTAAILPTVITDAPGVLTAAVEAALAARGAPGILGLHIEGPHLSQARRGTHAAEWVRPFEEATLAHVRRLRAAGVFVKITVAPEAVSPAQVAELAATGAVVSIGHSDATAEEARALLAAGASCFTHLFNAMSPMLNRAPGVTGACINSTAHAGIICDGHHVADEMVGLALRARPEAGRMFLVSDAMSTVGGSDRFRLYGQEVRLEGGRLVNAEGSLAGAHVTMAEGVRRLIARVGVAPETALDMALGAPARLLGRAELASPEHRDLAELVWLGPDWSLAGVGAALAPALAA
jgi:N-acetylglucosamine-6-phosphate deacetylase